MRKHLVSLTFLSVATTLGASLAWAKTDIRPGMWSGGYGTLEGDAPIWHTMIADMEIDGSKIRGPIRPAGNVRGHIKGDGIVLNIQQEGRRVRCEARLQAGVLLGTCEGGDEPYQLQLVHEEEPSEEVKKELATIFATETGGRIAIRKSIHLILTDFETGAVRVLYADGPDRFLAGERMGVPRPVALRVQFQRDGDGVLSGLVVQDVVRKTTRRATPCCRSESEEFTFVNGDVTLAGTLYLPVGDGPHPAVVYVHGSGRQTRDGAGTWPLFLVDRGFAVLAYDKRGQGESGGSYTLPGGGRDNQPHMKRRSTDVLAAVLAVKKRADIDSTQVGLMGGSQAGWIMPMVAETGEAAFTVTLSGGATELSIEGRFSNWAREDGSGGDSIDEILARLRRFEPSDYDFRPHFIAQKAPGLWLYGGLDRSNPSVLCIEMLEKIREENGNDFTVAWFPEANHGLWQARVGGAAEYATLTGMVPGLHRTISDWLDEKGFGPGGAGARAAAGTVARQPEE